MGSWFRTLSLSCVLCWVFVANIVIPSAHASSENLSIAAAADLAFAFKELIADFEKQTGEKVTLTLGSSGHFYTQIVNGGPFDLFFSADISYPKKLIEAGLGVPESLYQYVIGRIVLWTRKESSLDVTKGLSLGLDPTVKKLAIANPKHAPYGRAACSAME